jgi:serine/threonine-protein kinase RsbW
MSPEPASNEITIASDLSEARALQERIEEGMHARSYSEHDIFGIKLAVEEALVNAIKHGNQMDPDKQVHVTYRISPDRFEIQITDEGEGFDPAEVPDPTDPINIERPCGRGLLLIRGFMTDVKYLGRGNVVSMTKLLNGCPDEK